MKKEMTYNSLFVDLLTIVFIVLKLCGVITWSWVWVLSPIWISLVIALIIIIGLFILNKKIERGDL